MIAHLLFSKDQCARISEPLWQREISKEIRVLLFTAIEGDFTTECKFQLAATGVDTLQKESKNAQGGKNSAQDKFGQPSNFSKIKVFFSLEIRMLSCFWQ